MNKHMVDEFQKVCTELSLSNTPDFGIINADGERTFEFIEYIESNKILSKPIKFTYVELILASMNESILKNLVNEELDKRFRNYVIPKIRDKKWYPQFDYWIEIKSRANYPVGFLIESILNETIE